MFKDLFTKDGYEWDESMNVGHFLKVRVLCCLLDGKNKT